jgi:hypothetical protein
MKYNTSLFGQILQIIPRTKFARIVRECKAERHSKGFSCWDQFVSMLFCQFAQCKSLREISDGLAVTFGKLVHLGMKIAPAKSTLAYANAHRTCRVYSQLFYELLEFCRAYSPGKKAKFRFKNPLLSMDSTTISLCLSLFPWAEFRQTKGAIKLHMVLDHDGYIPTFAVITDGSVHDIHAARLAAFPKGSIVACDRAYCDYELFHKWTVEGVYFVTRQKGNAAYQVIEDRPIPQNSNVLSDQIICFTGPLSKNKCPDLMRRIVLWDDKNHKEVILLTNHLSFGATTIGKIYRDRWEIELFFKTLKQHLKIKTFVGTSPNALAVQIWTALIAILLVKFLAFKSKCKLPLCRLVALLRLNLFSYRDLWKWLDDPFAVPPIEPFPQLELAF